MAAGASRSLVTCTAFQCSGSGGGEKKKRRRRRRISPAASWRGRKRVPIAVVPPEKHKSEELPAQLAKTALRRLSSAPAAATEACWRVQAEILIERGVVGCQSFTLFAVAGSLIGSVLCFVEGCFLVLESFFHYFHAISTKLDQGWIIEQLIEAIGMFLVGTALLTFGMGLYVMFAASNERKHVASSNLKRLSDSMGMHSISQAKSKIGHAILLILEAGVVEKFNNVPLTTSLDLACFAGALFISSASVFLLSKLTLQQRNITCI